jgi:hypothetical protein
MKKETTYKRLMKLADFLDTVPPKHFDMEDYTRGLWTDDGEFSAKRLTNHECGTSACALGWAATIPEFKKAGLTLAWGIPECRGAPLSPTAKRFFGITEREADTLFYSHWNAGPKAAATRCRKVAARYA